MGNSLPNLAPKNNTGPTRLYVGSLHFNITEDMLRGIFEPFGKIDNIQLITDPESGKSKGYGFLTVSVIYILPPNYNNWCKIVYYIGYSKYAFLNDWRLL